jgi:hypothetical protein
MNHVDLHVHTTASDGTLTPAQTVALASELGLTAIAITDHDTVSGISEAQTAGKPWALKSFPALRSPPAGEGGKSTCWDI